MLQDIIIYFYLLQFETVDRFWAQLLDEKHNNILIKLWEFVNNEISLIETNPDDLVIDDFYIVMYREEKYRGKLMEFPRGPKKEYKVMYYFYLIYQRFPNYGMRVTLVVCRKPHESKNLNFYFYFYLLIFVRT